MRKTLPLLSLGLLTVACAQLEQKPKINASGYLTDKELERINQITFEVQKVLDIIDNFRETNALAYVVKIDVPGWSVYHKTENIAFFKQHKFIAEKKFEIPSTCVKNIGGAELNLCHIKLEQNLKRLGEAFDCEVKVDEIRYPNLAEKVKISCSY